MESQVSTQDEFSFESCKNGIVDFGLILPRIVEDNCSRTCDVVGEKGSGFPAAGIDGIEQGAVLAHLYASGSQCGSGCVVK